MSALVLASLLGALIVSAAGPWYLPGGKAMVREVAGVLSFITDAEECCCGEVTTTTPPPATTTPDTSPCGFEISLCPQIYYADVTTGWCEEEIEPFQGANCNGLYTMDQSGEKWYSYGVSGGAPTGCCGELYCHWDRWYLSIFRCRSGVDVGEGCGYEKVISANECAAGNYSLINAGCNNCAPAVTVYS